MEKIKATTICEGCGKEIDYNERNVDPITGDPFCNECVDKAWQEKRAREIRGF